jgi:hypothetical protein
MKHFDDLKYIDYVIRFTKQLNRTNELMLVCLNLMKEDTTLTIREVIDKGLIRLDIQLDNSLLMEIIMLKTEKEIIEKYNEMLEHTELLMDKVRNPDKYDDVNIENIQQHINNENVQHQMNSLMKWVLGGQ